MESSRQKDGIIWNEIVGMRKEDSEGESEEWERGGERGEGELEKEEGRRNAGIWSCIIRRNITISITNNLLYADILYLSNIFHLTSCHSLLKEYRIWNYVYDLKKGSVGIVKC